MSAKECAFCKGEGVRGSQGISSVWEICYLCDGRGTLTDREERLLKARGCHICSGNAKCRYCTDGIQGEGSVSRNCAACYGTDDCIHCKGNPLPPLCSICRDSKVCVRCTEGISPFGRPCGECKGSSVCQRCPPPKKGKAPEPVPPKSAWAHLTEDED